jgi:hypothetical protein
MKLIKQFDETDCGAATYIENKQLTLNGRNIVSSGVGVGLEQRLPRGGRISAETKYALAKIADMFDFQQELRSLSHYDAEK